MVNSNVPQHLAVTGRVEDWSKNPEGRLPVSCTTFSVEDSMEDPSGIEDSWIFLNRALRSAAGVAMDLSKLRPSGTSNGKGLVSSGPCSFAGIYSHFNQVLRRGGTYKNGAVTLYLDYDHPDIEEYLNLSPSEIPWAKRAIYVDENLMNSPYIDLIVQRLRDGSIWLAKKQWNKDGTRLYSNVCMEILIKHRGTCLLSHVNLGSPTIAEIPQAYEDSMEFLCSLHAATGVGQSGIYLDPSEDKQVGLGAIGLSNLLAIEKVTYADFVDALEIVLGSNNDSNCSEKAMSIAYAVLAGHDRAAAVARKHGMERAFTIAPTATCSYRYRDRDGYTTSPEISPPNCHPVTKSVIRESETFGDIPYDYHPSCETTTDVDWNTQYRLMKAWQRLMNSTGLAHAISFNIWDKAGVDKAFVADWLESPLKTTYYSLRVSQFALDKSHIPQSEAQVCSLDSQSCTSCSE
jgi:Ribonucleotide reductase, barrel domain